MPSLYEKFQWKLKSNNNTILLDFSSRTDTTRTFKNGVYLDLGQLTMKWNDQTYDLIDVKGHTCMENIL